MQLTDRLAAVAAMVTPGRTVADIGTDHAYIPIYLVKAGIAPHAIAMDVNRGPLARAREHIGQYGLGEKIETRLSDGMEALLPGEAGSVVIAGMGGPLTVRILENGLERISRADLGEIFGADPGRKSEVNPDKNCETDPGKRPGRRSQAERWPELVLQPQSEIRAVRAWLNRNGWRIAREDMVCEDGKFYPMMRAIRRDDREMTDMELRFGPLLLRERHPVLREYLLRERNLDQRILLSLEGQTGAAALSRAEEVRAELRLAEGALALYGC